MFYPQVLTDIIDAVANKEKNDEIYIYAKKHYDLHQFNICTLYPKQVRKMYDSLIRRYNTKEINILPTNWNEGERRIFVWFIICFLYLNNLALQDLNLDNLKELSIVFYFKTPIFIEFQLKNIPRPDKGPKKWSVEQDKLLREIICQLKAQTPSDKCFNGWNDVAKLIYFKTDRKIFKTPKSCRQRWYNHVDSSKKKDQFTVKQDFIIINHIIEENKSWSRIVKLLNNQRTQHRVKNRYYTLLRKYQKTSGCYQQVNEQTQPYMLKKIRKSLQTKSNQLKRQNYIEQQQIKKTVVQQQNEQTDSKQEKIKQRNQQKKLDIFQQSFNLQQKEEEKNIDYTHIQDRIAHRQVQMEAFNNNSYEIQNKNWTLPYNYTTECSFYSLPMIYSSHQMINNAYTNQILTSNQFFYY